MIKEIIRDKEFLSQTPEPGTAEDAQVAQDLVDTIMANQEDCACLAANPIGYCKAIAAFKLDDEDPQVMFNPRIKAAMKPYKAFENCLSLDEGSNVTRFDDIKVVFEELVDGQLVARQKRYTDWTAEIVQHCIDHCHGRLV